jgi:hypothetical protein
MVGGKSIFERQGFRIDMKPLIIDCQAFSQIGLHRGSTLSTDCRLKYSKDPDACPP